MARLKRWIVKFGLWMARLGGLNVEDLAIPMPSPEMRNWIELECAKFNRVPQSGDFKRAQVYAKGIKRFGVEHNHLIELAIAMERSQKHYAH